MVLEQNDEWSLNRRYMQLEGLQTHSAILHPLGCPQWHAEYRVSQPVRAADLHHYVGHDLCTFNGPFEPLGGTHGHQRPFLATSDLGFHKMMNKQTLCGMAFTVMATLASAAPVGGQGTWETTLQGRDISGRSIAASASAAVFLYDVTLNITWLKNANVNGQMTWQSAQTWVQSMQVGTFTGWRLPTTTIPDTSCTISNGNPSIYSLGYGVGCTASEMGHMFNTSLGNAPDQPISNTGNFDNVQNYYYWSSTPLSSDLNYVWTYQTSINGQAYTGTGTNPFFAFAVRDGDVLVNNSSTITYSAQLSPATTISTNWDFGPVAVGSTSAEKIFQLTNTGTGTLTFSSAPILSPQFSLSSNTCNTPLTAGASCNLGVTFAPTKSGSLPSSELILQFSELSGYTVAWLNGTGVSPTGLTYSAQLSPTTVWDFGSVAVGSLSAEKTYVLTNTGTGDLTFSASPILSPQFSLSSNTCSAQLSAGALCNMGRYICTDKKRRITVIRAHSSVFRTIRIYSRMV